MKTIDSKYSLTHTKVPSWNTFDHIAKSSSGLSMNLSRTIKNVSNERELIKSPSVDNIPEYGTLINRHYKSNGKIVKKHYESKIKNKTIELKNYTELNSRLEKYASKTSLAQSRNIDQTLKTNYKSSIEKLYNKYPIGNSKRNDRKRNYHQNKYFTTLHNKDKENYHNDRTYDNEYYTSCDSIKQPIYERMLKKLKGIYEKLLLENVKDIKDKANIEIENVNILLAKEKLRADNLEKENIELTKEYKKQCNLAESQIILINDLKRKLNDIGVDNKMETLTTEIKLLYQENAKLQSMIKSLLLDLKQSKLREDTLTKLIKENLTLNNYSLSMPNTKKTCNESKGVNMPIKSHFEEKTQDSKISYNTKEIPISLHNTRNYSNKKKEEPDKMLDKMIDEISSSCRTALKNI